LSEYYPVEVRMNDRSRRVEPDKGRRERTALAAANMPKQVEVLSEYYPYQQKSGRQAVEVRMNDRSRRVEHSGARRERTAVAAT